MLTAVARALRFTLDERDHLFRLAGHAAPERRTGAEHVHPALLRVLDRLDDTPAQVVSDLKETLVQNHGARALLGEQTHFTGRERYGLWRWFTGGPGERGLYPADRHAEMSRLWAADLRAALGRDDSPSRRGLVEDLLAASPEFAEVWARHEVGVRREQRKVLRHPEVGEVEVDCQVLHTEDLGQSLLVFTATPGTPDDDKLRLLSVVGTQLSDDGARAG